MRGIRRSGGSIAARLRDLERAILPQAPFVIEAGDLSPAAEAEAIARHRAAFPRSGPVVMVPEGTLQDMTPEEWQRRDAPDWARGLAPIVIDAPRGPAR